jgi:hypothetical protein
MRQSIYLSTFFSTNFNVRAAKVAQSVEIVIKYTRLGGSNSLCDTYCQKVLLKHEQKVFLDEILNCFWDIFVKNVNVRAAMVEQSIEHLNPVHQV